LVSSGRGRKKKQLTFVSSPGTPKIPKTTRTDKYLRRLDAVMVVADSKVSLSISGGGDVLEPHDGVLAIGSGSPYALAAARALMDSPALSAREICERAMRIAADACIYTNDNFTIEEMKIESAEGSAGGEKAGGGGGGGGEAAKKEKEKEKEKK
jgi:ATP-dependent HslUV protease subunit HslV